MKINNKGFAISTMMYMILILALTITFCALAILNNRNQILNNLKENVKSEVNDVSITNNYICKLKNGTGDYTVGDLYSCDVSNTEYYDFYVLSVTDNDVNFVMSEPLTFDKGNYNETVSVDIESMVKYNVDSSDIPVSALTVLKVITDNWFYLDNRTDIFEDVNYTIDYTGYKARLLSFYDIQKYINGNDLEINFINDTLTSSIYNDNFIYSISSNKVIVNRAINEEYNIVPVITVVKEKIKN